ncbi:eCIS core domain-containing protein [Natranaeroarchaeum aerophilus]
MEDHRIQRATEGTTSDPEDIPEPVLDVVGGEGMRLESSIQRSLEDRMDADFSDVRIHTGADATKACEAIDARAFTCGNKIAFNSGEYNPESPEGQYLLAHELAHVKQQTGVAAISMMPKEGGLQIDPDPQLEREADEAAAQALSGEEPLVVNRMGADVHIQRMSIRDKLPTGGGDGDLTETVKELTERVTALENQQDSTDSSESQEPGKLRNGWNALKDKLSSTKEGAGNVARILGNQGRRGAQAAANTAKEHGDLAIGGLGAATIGSLGLAAGTASGTLPALAVGALGAGAVTMMTEGAKKGMGYGAPSAGAVADELSSRGEFVSKLAEKLEFDRSVAGEDPLAGGR